MKTTLEYWVSLRGRTRVRIKGQNLNFYLETHANSINICFMWLRHLIRVLVNCADVWMTLKVQRFMKISKSYPACVGTPEVTSQPKIAFNDVSSSYFFFLWFIKTFFFSFRGFFVVHWYVCQSMSLTDRKKEEIEALSNTSEDSICIWLVYVLLCSKKLGQSLTHPNISLHWERQHLKWKQII